MTRKDTQRDRLVAGMVDIANRDGYAAASIAAVIARAGVSRPTFYDYFADRDDCFRAALLDIQRQLAQAVSSALEQRPQEESAAAAVKALVQFAGAEPARARFLMSEALAGDSDALDVRDRAVAETAALIEAGHGRLRADARAPDIESRTLVGGICRVLGARLRSGQRISILESELLSWLDSYTHPAGSHRWRKPRGRAVALAPSAHLPAMGALERVPGSGPPRQTRTTEDVDEHYRLRILQAVAATSAKKGYSAATLADITRSARVDGSTFYRLFSDKRAAFLAVHELGFRRVLCVTSTAFFAEDGWPMRSWQAGLALTSLLQENPVITRVGLVEAYAAGHAAVERIDERYSAFLFYLQEGLAYRPQSTPPSWLAMQAILATITETIYAQARTAGKPQITATLPRIAHLWLAPFLGVEDATHFIDGQMTARRRPGA